MTYKNNLSSERTYIVPKFLAEFQKEDIRWVDVGSNEMR
jgi:hypothetical protein